MTPIPVTWPTRMSNGTTITNKGLLVQFIVAQDGLLQGVVLRDGEFVPVDYDELRAMENA